MQAEFMSLQDVGDALGVDVQTVRRWVKAGRLKAFKPGKGYRIRESDLEEFLRTRAVRPRAATRLREVRDKYREPAEHLLDYCERFASGQENPQKFFADFPIKSFLLGQLYVREMWSIGDALGMARRAGEKVLSGVPEEAVGGEIDAQFAEHSLMREAAETYFATGRALAEAAGDVEGAEGMRRAEQALTGAAA